MRLIVEPIGDEHISEDSLWQLFVACASYFRFELEYEAGDLDGKSHRVEIARKGNA